MSQRREQRKQQRQQQKQQLQEEQQFEIPIQQQPPQQLSEAEFPSLGGSNAVAVEKPKPVKKTLKIQRKGGSSESSSENSTPTATPTTMETPTMMETPADLEKQKEPQKPSPPTELQQIEQVESPPNPNPNPKEVEAAAGGNIELTQQKEQGGGGRRKRADDNLVVGLPQRPQAEQAQGNRAVQVNLVANYFPFAISANSTVYQYAVSFDPPLEASGMRTKIVYKRAELGPAIACDGNVLYVPKKIPDQNWITVMAGGQKVSASIRFLRSWSANDNIPYQLCNILLKRLFREMKMVLIGRNNYDPNKKIQLAQYSIEIWPGVVSSVIPISNCSSLICDVSHKAVRMDSVLQTINEARGQSQRGGGQGDNWKANAEAEIIGSIVLTRYNNKTYRIEKIAWDMTPNDTFDWEGHGKTSFAQYTLRVYDKKCQDLKQPLLVASQRKKSLYVIPEFCTRTGLTEAMKRDFRVMSEIAVHTRPDPQERAREEIALVARITRSPDCKKQLDQWGISVQENFTLLKGTVLPTPTIAFSDRTTAATDQRSGKADWTFAMQKNPALSGVSITKWIVLFPGNRAKEAQSFAGLIGGIGQKIGLSLGSPMPVNVPSQDDYFAKAREAISKQPQFILCLVEREDKNLYNTLKKMLCHDNAIPSQVIKIKTLGNKHLDAVALKIALQIICKMGGEAWSVPNDIKDSMLVGIDVCHATPIGQSVAGLCATTNQSFTKYYSETVFQPRGKEIIGDLSSFVVKALAVWKKKNGHDPKSIIVFRDGVGDGQLEAVRDEEVAQFKSAILEAGLLLQPPKLVFLVVKKRIHTRLFTTPNRTTFGNPVAGTVVDSTIMHKDWYDFFLISQSVNQGTVSPTHFHVIEDELKLRPQQLQYLTFQLCHLYFNWSGTIRVPAPCQYAHKLAFLVGQNIQSPFHQHLSEKLFFL